MVAPTRDTTTTSKKIVVDWVALTSINNGGSDVTSYNLYWDAGSSGVSWFSLIGETSGPYMLLTFPVTSGVNLG